MLPVFRLLYNIYDDLKEYCPSVFYKMGDYQNDRVRRYGVEIVWDDVETRLVVQISNPNTSSDDFMVETMVYNGTFHHSGPWDKVIEIIYHELLDAIEKGKQLRKKQEDEEKARQKKVHDAWAKLASDLVKRRQEMEKLDESLHL